MRGWFVLVLLTLAGEGVAQTDNLNDLARAKYVERFTEYFFVWPVVKQRSTSFDLQNQHDHRQKLTYKPNAKYHAGMGAYVFGVGIQFVLAIPTSLASNQQMGESDALDLQANILGKSWAADLFTQNYKGYYLTDATRPVPAGGHYFHRSDIRTRNTGINGSYFFDKRRFSIRSTFNYYERQLKSAGSFILSGSINTFSLRADSAIYSKSYESWFGQQGNFSQIRYTTVAIAPGYAYNLVIHHSLFAGAALAVGPGLNWLKRENGAVEGSTAFQLNTYLDLRLSVGYNGEHLFAGITYLRQARNITYESILLTSSNNVFKFAVGYRFRQVGILKKRAIDILRPKTST